MSVLDKWLNIHRQSGGLATSATLPRKPSVSAAPDVASHLRQVATRPSESGNVATMSQIGCDIGPHNKSKAHGEKTANVAMSQISQGGHVQEILETNATVAESREGAPLVLRDGRRLNRFRASEIPTVFDTKIVESMDRARRFGAVLVADGMTLDVVEPRRRLPPELLADLRRDAGAVIAALRGESRRRTAGKELVTDEAAVGRHDGR